LGIPRSFLGRNEAPVRRAKDEDLDSCLKDIASIAAGGAGGQQLSPVWNFTCAKKKITDL